MSARIKTIELNERDFDNLIRGTHSRLIIIDEQRINWQWHKEMTIRQLQVLRQLIDSAINDFTREKMDNEPL